MASELANLFHWQVRMSEVPNPVPEFRALPDRQYKWDFGWPAYRLLVEIQGGTFSRKKMGHNSGSGLHRDYEKLNLAVLAGWRQFMFAEHHIRDGKALLWIQEIIAQGPPQ